VIELLRVRNLALLEEAELAFGPGLSVLTGETGAGKSLLLGALALLAGARASADAVREGAEEAVVEAVFRTGRLPELRAELERRGLAGAGDELVVSRVVAGGGRGRARVGGELVPVATLAELFAGRLEISSQHESQVLLRPEAQGRLLDAAGGLLEQREAVGRAYECLRALRLELEELLCQREERARREDFLRFQVSEIDEAKVTPGERDELRVERARWLHAERLSRGAAEAARGLASDPSVEQGPAALDLLGEALRRVEGLGSIDPALGPLAERLRAARVELADLARELAGYAEGVEADPGRLAQLDERLALLERLTRKYGPDEAALLAFREQAAAELAALAGAEDRLAALEAGLGEAREELERAASRLRAGRRRAAQRLGREVESRLRELAMPEARFEVALEPAAAAEGMPCGPSGTESVALLLSANPGEPPAPLRRVASGGELSRVLLALKGALRSAQAGMVLVFDEVDAGIGGRVADRVGKSLRELAREHQVLCITHLPQIAARADLHFRVDRHTRRGRTLARVAPLEGEERVEEIARMAAGETVGEAARRHARELLRTRGSR
jgi:DNA repair protein RecN (Recombination protein N)